MDQLILQIHSLIIENKKFSDELAYLTSRVDSLELSTPSKPLRSRTITPVSDDDRCSQTLVSGKNKGGQCSKKSTVGSLCTMHHKKITPAIFSNLSDEFVPKYILDEEK